MTATIKSLEVMIDHIAQVADLLHEAITDSEWSLVSEAYYILCGERIDIPEPPQEADMAAMLQQMMSRLDNLENNKEPARPKRKKGRPKKRKVEEPVSKEEDDFSVDGENRSRKVSDRAESENKFEDMEDVISEAGRDSGFDQINDSKNPKRKRNTRRKYKQASVTCGSCNNTFQVNPMFARENYTCDGCLTRRG